MRVALVQMNSKDEKAENLERAEMLIAQAAAWGSDLVVLPELWTYLGPRKRHAEVAEPIPGETTEFLGRLAAPLRVLARGRLVPGGRRGEERVYNTSVVLNPDGELVARYRKLHLFDVEVEGTTYQESATMAPGEEVVVASLAGVPVGPHALLRPPLPGALPAARRLGGAARSRCPPPSPWRRAGTTGRSCCGPAPSRTRCTCWRPPSAARIRRATPATGTRCSWIPGAPSWPAPGTARASWWRTSTWATRSASARPCPPSRHRRGELFTF